MSLTTLTENLNTIQSLPDQPALTSEQLKAKFDESSNKIKTYVNETLIPELNTILTNLQNKDTTLETAMATMQSTITEAVGNITSIQSTLSGLKSGATTKITIGSEVPSSLENGEVYFQYFS